MRGIYAVMRGLNELREEAVKARDLHDVNAIELAVDLVASVARSRRAVLLCPRCNEAHQVLPGQQLRCGCDGLLDVMMEDDSVYFQLREGV